MKNETARPVAPNANHLINGAVRELEEICNLLRTRCANMAGALAEAMAAKEEAEKALESALAEVETLKNQLAGHSAPKAAEG